jgi:hypothetical protein
MHKFICPVSTVGITIGYNLDGWGSIPAKARDSSLFHSVHTGSVIHPASSPIEIRSSFLRGKAAGL